MIWDDHQGRCIGELSFRSQVALPSFPHLYTCGTMKDSAKGRGVGRVGGRASFKGSTFLNMLGWMHLGQWHEGSACGRILHFECCMHIADKINVFAHTRRRIYWTAPACCA